MKQSIVLILLLLSFFSCQDVNTPEKPKNLIAKEKMIEMLTETYLINAARSVNNNEIISKGIKIDSMVYFKYKVDSLQFARSNAYYAADVDGYMKMIQEIEAKLLAMRVEMDSIMEIERARKDSVSERLNAGKLKSDSLN